MAVASPPRPVGKAKAGTIYRGKTGMWTFILHRVTGLAILGFLFLHIVGISFIGVSAAAYDTIESLYKSLLFRFFEVGLLFALVFHAVNGLRITAIDFFPPLTSRQRPMVIAQWVVIVVVFVPSAVIMFAHYLAGD